MPSPPLELNLSLCLVIDPDFTHHPLSDLVRHSVRGGVAWVQLRSKTMDSRSFLKISLELRKLTSEMGVPLIINDRVDVALACGADGVHLGQKDLPANEARKILGPKAIIGLSVTTLEDVERANQTDLTYVSASPLFPTQTKSDAESPVGLEQFQKMTRLSRHPVVAIGGISSFNAGDVKACGGKGVAVVSSICNSKDPFEAAKKLRLNFQDHVPTILTIAGSDSGSGAGIQADLKTAQSLNAFALTALTGLTAQNTQGIQEIQKVSGPFLERQLQALVDDFQIDAIKIGALFSEENLKVCKEFLCSTKNIPVVLDPIFNSSSGHDLAPQKSFRQGVSELSPHCELITPNLIEAKKILGKMESPEKMAKLLSDQFNTNVLVKGGHGDHLQISKDWLFQKSTEEIFSFQRTRIQGRNFHGTGCTLSTAIACFLAQGHPLQDAVGQAEKYMTEILEPSQFYEFGKGQGPLIHSIQKFSGT